MKFFFLIALTMTLTLGKAQTGLTEITTTDITKLSDFDGRKISFYGLHAGMSKQEALQLLKKTGKLKWEIDSWNTKSSDPNSTEEFRIYVNMVDDAHGEKELELAYLIWEPGSLQMQSLVLFNDAVTLMQGDTKKLFTPAALKPGNSFTRFLKSTPAKENGITTTYTYAAEHFAFIRFNSSSEGEIVRFKFLN